ncbi:hypothetical protein ALI22I_08115 [Saccharothrix sp. ALI-22-I]|nr:hypothetical protein ALI22I_08115 [Saccharothrix sp. ALI-22-I]
MAVAVLAFRAVFVVPHGKAVVVERLGRFRKVAQAGVNVRVPLIDRERARVDLREHVITTPLTDAVASGNLMSWVTMRVAVQVVDVEAVVYANASWVSAVELSARVEFNNHIGTVPWPEAMRTRRGIDEAIHAFLRTRAGQWGIAVKSVELTVDSRIFGAVVL